MTHGERWVAFAATYIERFGFSVIPMGTDKRPLVKWLEYQERRPGMGEILSWPKENLAIITGAISGIVVVDCESREDAEWFHCQHGGSPAVVQTRRGFHFYFRHPGERVKNGIRIHDRYDVRGDGGYVLAPPSQYVGGEYRWVHGLELRDLSALPVFRAEWRPEVTRTESYERVVHDGPKYISHIRAIAGQGGHSDTYRAACILRESGLSEAEALVALQYWNKTNADPPWGDKELLHKIKEAYQ